MEAPFLKSLDNNTWPPGSPRQDRELESHIAAIRCQGPGGDTVHFRSHLELVTWPCLTAGGWKQGGRWYSVNRSALATIVRCGIY